MNGAPLGGMLLTALLHLSLIPPELFDAYNLVGLGISARQGISLDEPDLLIIENIPGGSLMQIFLLVLGAVSGHVGG